VCVCVCVSVSYSGGALAHGLERILDLEEMAIRREDRDCAIVGRHCGGEMGDVEVSRSRGREGRVWAAGSERLMLLRLRDSPTSTHPPAAATDTVHPSNHIYIHISPCLNGLNLLLLVLALYIDSAAQKPRSLLCVCVRRSRYRLLDLAVARGRR